MPASGLLRMGISLKDLSKPGKQYGKLKGVLRTFFSNFRQKRSFFHGFPIWYFCMDFSAWFYFIGACGSKKRPVEASRGI